MLFSIIFTINVGIGTYSIYFHWCLKKDVTHVNFGTHTQRFNKLINGRSKTNRDQKSNLLSLWSINLKHFDSKLLKIDKKHHEGVNNYYNEYITIKKIDNCENIYSVNTLYLLVNHASEYMKEKNGNKYLIFDDSVNENKALLKNMQMFEMELKTKSKQ